MTPKIEDKTKRLTVIAPETLLAMIDLWRRQQVSPPNVSEAVRRLIELGVQADRADKKGGKERR